MSNNNEYDPFDPMGMFRSLRDTGMDSWAKVMTDVVNTESYAQATGAMLDAWLANSAPFQKLLESNMNQTLSHLKLPTRDDVTRLAERLTNIEMRLDDLDAKLDEDLAARRRPASD